MNKANKESLIAIAHFVIPFVLTIGVFYGFIGTIGIGFGTLVGSIIGLLVLGHFLFYKSTKDI